MHKIKAGLPHTIVLLFFFSDWTKIVRWKNYQNNIYCYYRRIIHALERKISQKICLNKWIHIMHFFRVSEEEIFHYQQFCKFVHCEILFQECWIIHRYLNFQKLLSGALLELLSSQTVTLYNVSKIIKKLKNDYSYQLLVSLANKQQRLDFHFHSHKQKNNCMTLIRLKVGKIYQKDHHLYLASLKAGCVWKYFVRQ